MIDSSKILIGVSHEMRSYMNSIVGFSFLAEAEFKKSESNMQYSDRIMNSCNQLLWLLDNFLESAMIDIGNPKINLKCCKLNSILDKSVPVFLEVLKLDNSKDIQLINENVNSDLTEVYIDSDKTIRIIQCLFRNAVSNMISGYIKIGYKFNENRVTFYVLDTQQDYIKPREFLYSNDLDKSLTKYFDACTAVNITMAKKLVDIMGGSLTIVSHEVTGTGVYLSIPVEKKNRDQDSKDENGNRHISGVKVVNYSL